MENFIRDLRYALRNFRKDRRFPFIAILALALGIGATTVMFSVIYNVFFDPFPYKNFNRTVVLRLQNTANEGGWKGRSFFSRDEFLAFRDHNHVFDDFIGIAFEFFFYNDGKGIRKWHGARISASTFEYLGVQPLLGRVLTPEDEKSGAPPVFVMNYKFWQSEFGGDPKIIGKTFVLSDEVCTLVGIMPPRFNAFEASVWLTQEEKSGGLQIMGRLKPGVSVETAAADLDDIAHRLRDAKAAPFSPEKFQIVVETLIDSKIGGFKKTLYALLAAVLLLLLIACSNVANLLLAKATTREREMAMRATMGATRGRLIRQLLVESFALAATASIVGCALGYFGLKVVVALIPAGTLPEETNIHMNLDLLLVTLGITLATTVLCGLAPALHVAGSDLQPGLSGSSKGAGGSFRHGKLRGGLVVTEVALSIILLIGAGILMRSFIVLTRVDFGFNPRNVLYFRIELPHTYNTDLPGARQRISELTRRILERVSVLPGVTAIAESAEHPPLNYDWTDTIIPGKPHTERWETRYEMCSEGYFQTLGLNLLRGRFFSQDDVRGARYVMVVTQAFARQYFPNEDPIGKKVKLQVLDRPFLEVDHNIYFEIIGVSSDYKTRGYDVPGWQDFPQAFVPYSIQGFSWRTFLVRTAMDPNLLLKDIREEVRVIDPNVGIATSGTLDGALKEFYRGPQFELFTLGAFACVGMVLVVIGIFSVMAYTVTLQTHEIGIRMALGAQQGSILRFVLLNGFRLVAAGICAGTLGSYYVTRFLASQVSGVSLTDPWTFAAVVLLVVIAGLLACLLPARRAAEVDPLIALRHE